MVFTLRKTADHYRIQDRNENRYLPIGDAKELMALTEMLANLAAEALGKDHVSSAIYSHMVQRKAWKNLNKNLINT
jgi:hypothetical protein